MLILLDFRIKPNLSANLSRMANSLSLISILLYIMCRVNEARVDPVQNPDFNDMRPEFNLRSLISSANHSHNREIVTANRIQRQLPLEEHEYYDSEPDSDNSDFKILFTADTKSLKPESRIGGLSDRDGKEDEAEDSMTYYSGQCDTSLDEEKPLMCYQCKSSTEEHDGNLCDHTLWKYALKDELIKYRFRCPAGHGSYCVKKVQTKSGLTITERGCVGPGPVTAGDGSTVYLQEGCVTYSQNGLMTSTCLCKSKELCNAAIFPQPQITFPIVFICTILALFL